MINYKALSPAMQERIRHDTAAGTRPNFAARDEDAQRRWERGNDKQTLWRPDYVRDVEKILHCPYYNRYADKTQVFSFYKNDDITRRALHVQLVSRIARNIGRILGLNEDLIEAIALGHDIGHTPFGHAGERFLNELYHGRTGRLFNHNVHSVRVLDKLCCRNISLQTLDGILCHNGELPRKEYLPRPLAGFAGLDRSMEACYTEPPAVKALVPATLEGCVVRICDIIAYLGKDRQDARKARILSDEVVFSADNLGIENAEIIHNLTVNIIENSYGHPYIRMDEGYFSDLVRAKADNTRYIYQNEEIEKKYNEGIRPMFEQLYARLLQDAVDRDTHSILYRHHVAFIHDARLHYTEPCPYEEEEPNQMVVDYIASMTDDYFVDLYDYLFPGSPYHVDYQPYFDSEDPV